MKGKNASQKNLLFAVFLLLPEKYPFSEKSFDFLSVNCFIKLLQ